MLDKLKQLIKGISSDKAEKTPKADEEEDYELCCRGKVHIAYRGLADDRMYISYDREWQEVKYFRQNNLRVFCSDCRRRVY